MAKFEFKAIGTTWVIDLKEKLSKQRESLLFQEIMDRIALFDIAYSRFRDDSLVTKMSKESGEFILPEDADKMISLYEKMYDVTKGLVTPLIGQVLVDAGYDAKYSLLENKLTKPVPWKDVIEWKTPKLTLKQPALLDFGAGGKGYLVDIVGEILEKNNIKSYCVDASGDMRYRNLQGSTLKVGLEHPDDKNQVIGVINIKNESICGSSGNRRKWGKFHHIINPETLSSPMEILSVWAVADNTLLSDLLTTALFFVEPETLTKHFKFEYLILYSDYSVKNSKNLDLELFT